MVPGRNSEEGLELKALFWPPGWAWLAGLPEAGFKRMQGKRKL